MLYKAKEDRFIIKNSNKLAYREMAFHLGRSEESVRQRIEILKRLGKLKRSGQVRNGILHLPYSKEEDNSIKTIYPTYPTETLIKLLKRSEASISYRASKLNVKKGPLPYLNVGKITVLMEVTRPIVIDWIDRGLLKASKDGRRAGPYQEHRVEFQDFYSFLRNYYFLYDADRVKDKFLRSIIESTPAGKAILVCQAAKVLGISKSQVKRRIDRGKLIAYKNFSGNGGRGFRWFVILDKSYFDWFRDLTDNQAAQWLVEAAQLRNLDSVATLDLLIKYIPEKVKGVRRRMNNFPAANAIVKKFEATPEGKKLSNLIE